jgi:hypothetical protein
VNRDEMLNPSRWRRAPKRPAPAPPGPAPEGGSQVPAPAAGAVGPSELAQRRDRLARQFVELQWDLGGLAYEMAIRDHFRLDVLVAQAADLQSVDAELSEAERLLRLDEAGAAGGCPNCGALYARGAVFCWQCGTDLMEQTAGYQQPEAATAAPAPMEPAAAPGATPDPEALPAAAPTALTPTTPSPAVVPPAAETAPAPEPTQQAPELTQQPSPEPPITQPAAPAPTLPDPRTGFVSARDTGALPPRQDPAGQEASPGSTNGQASPIVESPPREGGGLAPR